MAIKVLIERRIIPGKEDDLTYLLTKLRNKAMNAKGYIAGETLRSLDDPFEYLVISTWNSLDDWELWEWNEERQEIYREIDNLLLIPSIQRVFMQG